MRAWPVVVGAGLLIAACGEPDRDLSPDPTGRCRWSGAAIVPVELPRRSMIVGDVTGDGIDDWVTDNNDAENQLVAGPLPGTPWAMIAYNLAFVGLGHGDLNGDGSIDLVLTDPAVPGAGAFFGPIERGQSLAIDDADLAFPSGAPPGGLHDRYGAEVAVEDVTGDGVRDLVMTAPGEAEEGCFGARDSVVFPGPLASGRLHADDAPIRVSVSSGECLGDQLFVVDLDGDGDGALDMVLENRGRRTVVFHGPLAAGIPRTSDSADLRFDAPLLAAADMTGDGRAELLLGSGVDGIELMSSDGPISAPALAALFMNQAGVTAWLADRTTTVVAARVAFGEPAELVLLSGPPDAPVTIGSMSPDSSTGEISAGDLDADGQSDLLVGRNLFLCP